ncbi:MAG: glucosamine kinase [Sulfitobacter sp.]|jgi:glucosamine kinase
MNMGKDSILIAVDGGGTGCRAAVGTPTQGILAEAAGGPGNVNTGSDRAIANIKGAIHEALEKAGISDAPKGSMIAHIGVAGANFQDEKAQVAAQFDFGKTQVTSDRDTAVVGALKDADGFVVALGTGTIVARQKAGLLKTVSGWGFQLSDQASGAWLGQKILINVLMANDGMIPQTDLIRDILRDMGGVTDIVKFSIKAQPGDFAQLARRVVAAATAGDALALGLMQDGAAFIQTALAALDFQDGDRLCLGGGVGPHYAPYLAPELTRNLTPPEGNALQGAFNLARRAALAMA